MNLLQRFMAGRYGADPLSVALMLLSLIFMIVASVSGLAVFSVLSLLPMGWCFYRLLSRNTFRRRAENDRFLKGGRRAAGFFRMWFRRLRDLRTHRYFRCPHCKAVLRVPRGKGKIRVTCTVCQTRFDAKT